MEIVLYYSIFVLFVFVVFILSVKRQMPTNYDAMVGLIIAIVPLVNAGVLVLSLCELFDVIHRSNWGRKPFFKGK